MIDNRKKGNTLAVIMDLLLGKKKTKTTTKTVEEADGN